MSNALITIEGAVREASGKTVARKLRQNGKIPAVLLDKGKSVTLELPSKLLGKAYKECERKFNLQVGGETKVVVIHELQIDAVKRTPLHVDLMYVN